MKAEKLLAAAAAALALLICCSLVLVLYLSMNDTLRADRLYAKGDYETAAIYYEKAGNKERAEMCARALLEQRYLNARRTLQNGNYGQARDLLLDLDGYKDSQSLLQYCDILEAADLVRAGNTERAIDIYLSLKDFPGVDLKLQELEEPLYERARDLAAAFQIEEACEIWEVLGAFRDSGMLCMRGREILRRLEDPGRMALNDPARQFRNDLCDRVYASEDAYIVMPEKAGPETGFFLYYPGGRDEELYLDYFLAYLENPAPDTLAVFLRHNGLPDTESMSKRALEILDEAAADCGLFMHDPVVAASSLGVYPALHGLIVLSEEFGVKVPCFLALDAGNDWKETDLLLSTAECRQLAATGTELYLFESPWVGMDRPAIRQMVNSGCVIWLVGCERDEHAQITLDALSNGMPEWMLSGRGKPCPIVGYEITRLVPDA